MNPTYHDVEETFLTAGGFGLDANGKSSQYTVHAKHHPDVAPARLPLCHVPPELVPSFESGDVVGFHVETVPFGSIAKTLPGRPLHAVVAVKLQDGTLKSAVPRQWTHARRRLLVIAAASYVLVGALTVADGPLWMNVLAVLLSVFGTLKVCAAMALRCRPFEVGLSFGNRQRTPEGPTL